jgi:hypothetical protein
MNNSDNRHAKTPRENPFAADGGDMQRRRFGLTHASPGIDNLLSFPAKSRGEETPDGKDETCSTNTDNDTSPITRPSTGANSPRKNKPSPKRTRRGPNPIGVLMPTLALPKSLSGYRPQDVGLVTHATIAILAPHIRTLDFVQISERVLDVTGALVNGDNVNRRRVLMLTAAGHAANYLRRFVPAEPWELLGCEFDTGGGRTDLAWRNAETGVVFFDEIKTHNRPISALSAAVVGQVKRQAAGGVVGFGDMFAGVRLLTFGSLHMASLIHPDHKQVRLAATPEEPLRVRTEGDAS